LSAVNGRPLAEVEVAIVSLSRNTFTNSEGAFQLRTITPGTYVLTVRRVGYAPITETHTLAANQILDRTLVLSPVATLEQVDVRASVLLRSFEEHRALGLGVFMTRADLESQEGRQLTTVMAQKPGLHIARGRAGQGWLVSTRVRPSGREVFGQVPDEVYCPDGVESGQGMPCACYAQVYVDHMLMNPGRPTPPFSLGEFSAERVEAIEWYASPLYMPLKYQSRNASCGVLVIHTRR
jgi:hypothetical protein